VNTDDPLQSKYPMTEINFEPNLSSCVQTLARKQHEKIVRELLKTSEQDLELEKKAEMLKEFLESIDFRKLRKEYEPYLVKGNRVKFTLRMIEGRAEYDMEIK
jgi:hypothetical protein